MPLPSPKEAELVGLNVSLPLRPDEAAHCKSDEGEGDAPPGQIDHHAPEPVTHLYGEHQPLECQNQCADYAKNPDCQSVLNQAEFVNI